MADSNITKRALASSLKELMKDIPFEKITISNICDKCDMNRKSFYYHFKDKYDLVNWIFDTEFLTPIQNKNIADQWELIEMLAQYFYDNKDFYRKIMRLSGQNTFWEHFRDLTYPLLSSRTCELMKTDNPPEFILNLLSDIFVSVFSRWLFDKNCLKPEQFVTVIKSMTEATAISTCEEMIK